MDKIVKGQTPQRLSNRRGNVLVMAVILLGASMALITQSSDSVNGTYQQINHKLREQKTLAAAEAVASSHETALTDLLSSGDFFKVNTETNNYGQDWFGDCLVKWKIEPVPVYEPKNPKNKDVTRYVVNPDPDPNAVIPTGNRENNTDLYHYRIATEAVLSENGVVRCRAQAVRVVQMTLSRLFRYAIFYGQEGPAGDIEFAHGPPLNVAGAVHSNGAIYLAGASGPDTGNIGNVQGGGATRIGVVAPTNKVVTVTAIDGVFRQSKRYNYFHRGGAGYAGASPDTPDPMLIKDTALISNNNNRYINDIPVTKEKDSRGDVNFKDNSVKQAPTGWGGYLRTKVTGATVVKSLANCPSFAGRPLEPFLLTDISSLQEEWQRLPVYAKAGASFTPGRTLPYTALTSTPAAADLVNALNGPYLDYALGAKDYGGAGRTDLSNIATTNSYAMYLENTDPATGARFAVIPGLAGLILRERPNGGTTSWDGVKWNGITGNTPPDQPSTDVDHMTYVTDKALYASYMKSRYQVFLGRLDITDEFFAYPSVAQATATRRFVSTDKRAIPTASEDFFYNQREYYSQGAKLWSDKTIQRQSVLTLNLDAIQDFIRDTTLGGTTGIAAWNANSGRDSDGNAYLLAVDGNKVRLSSFAPDTDTLRQHFNGLIYAHRTNRAGAYNSTTNQPADFTNGIRVARGSNISWDHRDGNNPLGTSKLTIATPNQAVLWGDFNTVKFPTGLTAPGDQAQTPVALMCDMLTVQSNNFTDAAQNALAASSPPSTSWVGAATTTYNVALVVNNRPTKQSQKSDDASVHTFGWYMEGWGGTTYNFKGSIVVLNAHRYTRGFNQGADRIATPGTDLPLDCSSPGRPLYGAPTRNITFNEDLMTSAGTPPYSPFGVEVSRQVNYSYVVMTR